MKRFLRYLLLGCCILTISVWGWSAFHTEVFAYFNDGKSWAIRIDWGVIAIRYELSSMSSGAGFRHFTSKNSIDGQYMHLLGLQLPQFDHFVYPIGINTTKRLDILFLPIWFLFTPIFLLTLALWYHPIKNWWRGTDRQGFEVEMKKNERQEAEVAKEEIEKE